MRSRALAILIFSLLSLLSIAQSPVSVHGVVTDSLTGERLAYASISLDGLNTGARTDINGNFFIEVPASVLRLRVSYVGYKARVVAIQPGKHNELRIALVEQQSDLHEVTIRPKKYSNKNNPAVDLVQEVFRHKDQNRKEGLHYYSFKKYEKLQLDLNNITDKFRRRWYFRPFRFIFNNVDTNAVTQKVALPIYLRERVLEGYYRRDPQALNALLRGERLAGFVDENDENDDLGIDAEGVAAFLNSAFSEVDIYEPRIQLLGTEFVGPLSAIAPNLYRFYIIDTVESEGRKYADLFFAPRNKADLAFMGNMLVALDSTYSVMRVEMGVPKEINLNYVSELHIEQEFQRIDDGANGRLMLSRDAITADLKVLKNKEGRSLLSHRSSWLSHYTINQPIPDSLFKSEKPIQRDTGSVRKRSDAWWESRREAPLTRTQHFVDRMVDSIEQTRAFKVLKAGGTLLATGYQRVGFVNIGMLSSLYSYNDVEGSRFRLGVRTNPRLYKPLVLESYAAYGLRDQRWKYQAGVVYSLNKKPPRVFPQHRVSLSWQRDLRTPGLLLDGISSDNTVLSFQRSARRQMLFLTTAKLEYKREFSNQFSFSVAALSKIYDSAGNLTFIVSGSDPDQPEYAPPLNTAELGIFLRYAPKQQFYNGPNYRTAIPGRFPIFTCTFRNGFEGIVTGAYAYQNLHVSVEKRFLIAPFGYSDWTLNAGRIWGQVPYPLLEAHPANQTYFYDWYAFNLMNFLEFVSDKYVSLNVQHNFNGLILNKIPLIKKLQWREAFSFKAVYGGLDNRNNPLLTKGLFEFPKSEDGTYLTHILDRGPYMEMSVGVSNLFRLFRIDYVWRVNYTDLPGAPEWGLRAMFAPRF